MGNKQSYETVMEGNKLIAEFMKLPQITREGKSNSYMHALKEGFVAHEVCASSLEYHSSWDWLIPVINRIHSYGFNYSIVQTENVYEEFYRVYNLIIWINNCNNTTPVCDICKNGTPKQTGNMFVCPKCGAEVN